MTTEHKQPTFNNKACCNIIMIVNDKGPRGKNKNWHIHNNYHLNSDKMSDSSLLDIEYDEKLYEDKNIIEELLEPYIKTQNIPYNLLYQIYYIDDL